MFKEIFRFELRQGFKKVSTYIFFGIFFIIYLLIGLITSGVIPMATADTNLVVNSASVVAGILMGLNQNIMGLVNSVILIAVIATAIQKDYEYNTHALFYTKPISKGQYFFGRFLGAFFTGLFVFSGQILGYLIACLIGTGQPVVGPFHLMNFLEPFLLFTLPNLFLFGIIFFSITTFTRSTMAAYLFSVILLVIRSITDSITADLDNKTIAAILEPFGQEAFGKLAEYWTPEEQNTRLIPLEGVLLYNRLLWVGIALAITIYSYMRFSFSQFLTPFRWFKKKLTEQVSTASVHMQSLADLPVASRDFSTAASRRQLFYLAGFEFRKMTKSIFFVIICALGAAMMYVISNFTGAIYGTETYPVTYEIIEGVASIFQLFILILVVFFSGTIIWRDREAKSDELIGTTPVKNSTLFFSKYLGLIYVTGILLFVIMLTGIVIQLSQGFTGIDPLQYIKALFGFRLLSLIVTIGLCLAVQVFSPNKYLGFFLAIIPILLTNILFGLLEWNNGLYHFNSSGPAMQYSDMNGFGHQVFPFLVFKLYWLAVIATLCYLALRVFARGKEKGIKARYRLAKSSVSGKAKLGLVVSVVIAIGTGAFIYYNIAVQNKMYTASEREKIQVNYEKTYGIYRHTKQPRVVESTVDVDIYPSERRMVAKGFYYLKNKHAVAVDTVLINYDQDAHFKTLALSVPTSVIKDDKVMGITILRLSKPLAPGDSMKLNFELESKPKGFKNNDAETDVVYSGTFFNNSHFPNIGYNSDAELSENAARVKYKLKPKPRMADVHDSLARMNNYISGDADWIRFETTVSTSDDQTAIAPGYLLKEWKADGRRYFHYKMDSPILNFYSFLSAHYEIKRDKWHDPVKNQDVSIEVYYHKGHEYNLDKMIKSVKSSLAYYSKNFSPYQHRQMRIIEFPRYQTFAQAFPNTVPFSEGIGFIARVKDNDPLSIDYPFYVTAHEVGHQWWAHQVMGGNVQGGTLMSETMAQYSALMVMEKEYGKEAMHKFLKYEMNNYLMGRSTERKKEMPLMLVENQQYLHYNKGSVVMYALRDYLGEDTLNAALKRYIKKVAYQEPPYTNSIEFVNYLRAATPDSLKYLIHDMFETITLYENYIKDLSYTPTTDGKYKVKLTLCCTKFQADSLGKQQKMAVADYVDAGIFVQEFDKGKKKDRALLITKVKMDKPEKTFEFVVNEKPTKAGIDPYNKLIDRSPDNNTWEFGSKPPKVSTESGNSGMTISVGN